MKLKKVLASILAVAMLLSLANIAVLAEEPEVPYPEANVGVYNAAELASMMDGYSEEDVKGILSALPVNAHAYLENNQTQLSLNFDPFASTSTDEAFVFTTDDVEGQVMDTYGDSYNCDFVVSFDEDVDANSVILTGFYNNMLVSILLGIPFSGNNETKQFLISSIGFNYDYRTIATQVQPFVCTAINLSEENIGKTINVSLVMWPSNGNKETDSVVITTIPYTFTANNLSSLDIKENNETVSYRYVSQGSHEGGKIVSNATVYEQTEQGPHFATISEIYKNSTADFIDNAKGVDYTVTLNKLNENAAIDHDADATYKVVLDEAPESDVQAVETKLAEAVQADPEKTYEKTDTFDIKVIKIENDTEEEVQNVIVNQSVTIDLENAADIDKPLAVYHVVNGSAEPVTGAAFANEGKQVTFTAPSFSTYSVSYTPVAVNEENITDSIGIAFNKVSDDVYDIVVKAMDGKKIYRLMSTDLTFGLTPITGALSYEISPATYVNLIEKENGRYEFNFNGTGASYATGTEIKIGEVKFIGYGKAKFETTDAATNIVNTAKLVTDGTTTTDDNIVKHYTASGSIPTGDKLLTGDDVVDGTDVIGVIDPVEIKAATKDLTINVKFNNIISDNANAYQDMKVTVSGGDLTSPLEYKLGNGTNEIALNGDTYTVEIADTLTKNVGYTVKVEGAGYRTARHIVTMTENKVLNFWNNVKDSANATVIETGKTPMTKNFLAGDIVKDNNINIYDLSAVVSYFGTENLVSVHPEYAKYDLNRDGVIDSKDVAYVLVSWGE
jgi:hypothetical protein